MLGHSSKYLPQVFAISGRQRLRRYEMTGHILKRACHRLHTSPAQHIQHGRRLHKCATPQGCLLDVQDESSTQTHLAPALHVTGSTHRAARDMRSYSFRVAPSENRCNEVENIRRRNLVVTVITDHTLLHDINFLLGLAVHHVRDECA